MTMIHKESKVKQETNKLTRKKILLFCFVALEKSRACVHHNLEEFVHKDQHFDGGYINKSEIQPHNLFIFESVEKDKTRERFRSLIHLF